MSDPTSDALADVLASTVSARAIRDADNPLLTEQGLPRFDVIRPEHVVPGMSRVLENLIQQLDALETALAANDTPTFDDIFQPQFAMGRLTERTWGVVGHLMNVMNSDALREAQEEVQPRMTEFGLRMGQSEPIYNALRSLRDSAGYEDHSPTQKRIVEKNLQGMELSGFGLEGEKLERFNALKQESAKLSTQFSNNVLDATKAYKLTINNARDVEGLPQSLKALAAAAYNSRKPDDLPEATPDEGPWTITLEAPLFIPFLRHCRNRTYREQVYKATLTKASYGDLDNTGIANRLLALRKEAAALLGFDNYAEQSLSTKMADGPQAVFDLLEQLRSASWEPAVQDLNDLRELAAAGRGDVPAQRDELMHWDVGFWAERLKEQRFDFSEEDLRPYLSYELVMEGFFELVSRLFGITIKEGDGSAPVWHPDAAYFDIFDNDADGNATGEPIAGFYFDPFVRPETKRGGAWMDDCLSRDATVEPTQIPVAHLICNSTPPTKGQPALMSWREVETLFHEFGHGLQHMLTTVDLPEAAGISGVEWDAVELPSQFMENWCYHKPTIDRLAKHYETGEPLPDALFDKLVAARTYRAGSEMLRQVSLGLTDMTLHTAFDPNGDRTIFDVQRDVYETTSPLGMFEGDRFLCGFSHIFAGGYSAGYYSYKWAEVLSADAFGAFEDAGLDNPDAVAETGRRFRETVLSLGGSEHPMDVFKAFRGREPSPEALLRHNGLAE